MDKNDFTLAAQHAMKEAGAEDCSHWPMGTKRLEGVTNGGWGRYTAEFWELPTGVIICWDSDDREYSVSRKGARN